MRSLLPSIDHPSRSFLTSWLLPAPVLTAIRLLFAIYGLTVNITDYIYYSVTGSGSTIGQQFSYFTVLTYWGLTFYFLASGLHGVLYCLRGYSYLDIWAAPYTSSTPHDSEPPSPDSPIQQNSTAPSTRKHSLSSTILLQLHSLLYTTITNLPLLVTIVYWSTLYTSFPTPFSAFDNISRHALNTVFALIEIIISCTAPPPYIHILPLLLILLAYLGVAYITHATQGFYVYSFLDPATHGAGVVAAWIVGIAFGGLGLFLVVRAAIWARGRYLGGEDQGKRAYRDVERERVHEAKRSLSDLVSGVGMMVDVEAVARNGSLVDLSQTVQGGGGKTERESGRGSDGSGRERFEIA